MKFDCGVSTIGLKGWKFVVLPKLRGVGEGVGSACLGRNRALTGS